MSAEKPQTLVNESHELMDPAQTCTFLNLKRSKLKSLIFKNQIPVIRIGGVLRFNKRDLLEWLNEKKCY